MKFIYRYFILTLTLVLVAWALSSCATQPPLPRGESILLATTDDPANGVTVSIRLSRAKTGAFSLVATFTPPKGYHLYSKDIPRTGVRGQGRPTLIELPAGSKMQASGTLTESVGANVPGYVPDGAPIYPPGPVTMTLPVRLPDQAGWLDDQVSLTYMACTQLECSAPTVDRRVRVGIPGAQTVAP